MSGDSGGKGNVGVSGAQGLKPEFGRASVVLGKKTEVFKVVNVNLGLEGDDDAVDIEKGKVRV